MREQTVSIKKTTEVEAEIDVLVYVVKCKCGADLHFTAEVDRDYDLAITVDEHECVPYEV